MSTLGPVAFGPQIAAAAGRYGLDPKLLAAVAAQETGGPGSNSGANVVGDGGHGHGLFQIDDRYHAFASTPAAMDPGQNAGYAAGMLSGLLRKFGGNVRAALSAYNSGSPSAAGTTTNWGGRVLGYADSVLAHYAGLGGNPAALTGSARDFQIADLPEAAAAVNGLRNAASASTVTAGDQSAALAAAAVPCPTIPPVAQRAHDPNAQAPLKQDYFAESDDDGDLSPSGSRASS